MNPSVWIVPVNFNGLEDTRRCLRSLAALSPPAQVVVVDNASAVDPRPALAAEFPGVHLLRNPTNRGWSGGNNTGIRFALAHQAEFVILLNNDTVVRPDLVARLLAAAHTHPEFGILGPVIRYLDEPDLVMTDGTAFNRPRTPGLFSRVAVPEQVADPPVVREVDIVNGCCMLVRAEVFRRIGLIDDGFFLIHEESDFCLRAQRAGYRCGVLAEALVWHKGSSSFKRSGHRWQRYYDARNLARLLARHTAGCPHRRSELRSYAAYLRYVYHRWCHEREEGQLDAANAVLEGLIDALTRRYGKYQPRRRWGVGVVRAVFEAAHWLRPPRHSVPEGVRKDLWHSRGQP
jgi:GT2 family glycosyltransferase